MTSLRIVYRFYAGESTKPRPPYYSKRLALASFLRAFEALGGAGSVVFVNDGLPGEDILRIMRRTGEVVSIDGGSSRGSYLSVLAMPRQRDWQEDIFWFAEDDYLYAPDALTHLVRATDAVPEADYFALHGSITSSKQEKRECQTAQPPVWVEPLHRPGGGVRLDGRFWRRIDGVTSTFGMRREALRQDERLLWLCPWSGCAWDHTSCLVAQGYRPYPWRHLFVDLIVPSTPPNQRLRRATIKVVMRVAVNLRSHRRPSPALPPAPKPAPDIGVSYPGPRHAHGDVRIRRRQPA